MSADGGISAGKVDAGNHNGQSTHVNASLGTYGEGGGGCLGSSQGQDNCTSPHRAGVSCQVGGWWCAHACLWELVPEAGNAEP
jgi:hypothetical protein